MTKWLSSTILTCDYLGICFNEKDFHRELRRMKVPPQQWSSWLTQDALATTHHLTSDKGSRASIVCIPIRPEMDGITVAALLVHEAVHVIQETFDFIGEGTVGRETQAYAIQAVSERLMEAYRDRLYKEFDKAVKKDEKKWTTFGTSKPTLTPSPSQPSTQTVTTPLCSSVLPEGMTLLNYSIGLTNDGERKTG